MSGELAWKANLAAGAATNLYRHLRGDEFSLAMDVLYGIDPPRTAPSPEQALSHARELVELAGELLAHLEAVAAPANEGPKP